MRVLAADIGGTHTRLGIYDGAGDLRDPARPADLPTHGAGSAEELLLAYLDGEKVDAACLAVAGAVLDGVAAGSNLPWPVRVSSLTAAIGAPVRLLNDLEATAVGILELRPGETESLLQGRRGPHGPIGVIAPGTGLGQAILVWTGESYRALPSEAGHIDFAPGDELQADYWRYLHRRFGHVSLERACSGGSFRHLVEYLESSGRARPSSAIADAMERQGDATPAILAAGLAGSCEASRLAVETFVSMLGAAAGNLALQVVATGGIYLAGGIPPRLGGLLHGPGFATAFTAKGRFEAFMHRIPVDLVTETRCGLFGAARAGLGQSPAL